jgi:hypothetical protein
VKTIEISQNISINAVNKGRHTLEGINKSRIVEVISMLLGSSSNPTNLLMM